MKKDKFRSIVIVCLAIIIVIMLLLSRKQENYNLEDKIKKYELNVFQNKEKLISVHSTMLKTCIK